MRHFRLPNALHTRAIPILIVLVMVGGAILAGSPDNAKVADRRADISPEIPVYGYVGDQPVTGFDLRSNVRAVEANLAGMHTQIERTEFDAEREALQDVAGVIEEHGVVTAAVAGAVLDLTLYEHAIEWGLLPTHAQVQSQVARDRAQIRLAGRELPSDQFVGQIDVDTFWNEWYPSVIERRLAIDRLYQNRMAKLFSYGDVDPTDAWYQQTVDFVEDSSLVWASADEDFTQISLQDVVDYLKAMAEALPTEPLERQPPEVPGSVLAPLNNSASTA